VATGRYIFQCAEDAHREITSLFDFVQPTVIALWNLRWQVQGFLNQVPTATSDDLANRFALGSGMRGGELKLACVDTPWERQKSEFAEFVLSSVIAAFEDYTGRLAELDVTRNDKFRRKVSQSLQFPIKVPGQNPRGFSWAISTLTFPSSALSGVFQNSYKAHRRYSAATLGNLLICYRFFKCMRNMVAHNGGRADQETIDAYNRFSAVSSVAALGLPEVPEHNHLTLKGPIKLELRGVIGLSDIVLRIIRTYDVTLSESALAEAQIRTRVKPIPSKRQFAKKGNGERRITAHIYGNGFPKPQPTSNFVKFLKKESLVPHFW
jgi:hypothetical protein